MTDAELFEIERIRKGNKDGLLIPREVWAAAKDEKSPLHNHFTWDTQKAAEKYWDEEARQLIRAYVVHEPRLNREVRGYVSVPTDRMNGGGYRPMSDVLDRPDWVAQLTEEVKGKLTGMRSAYRHLKALDPLFESIESTVTKFLEQRQSQAA